ncbi:MAG: TolC family protein [Myxococcales bacterium]|nr:TolC family protein [Myxococcales bacterium]MCB9530793.1 TolC family protein [Myxococcales bacterium]
MLFAVDARATSLDEVLRYADENAPTVRVALARAELAAGAMAEAAAPVPANPELSVAAGVRALDGAVGPELAVSVRQQLEVAGEPRLRRQAASDQQAALQAELEEIRWRLGVEARQLAVALVFARERTEAASRAVEFSEAARANVARLVALGELSPLELLAADVEVAEAQERLLERRRLGEALAEQLAALTGWVNPHELDAVEVELGPLTPAPPIEALFAAAVDRSAGLRARERAVDAAQSAYALERRDATPEPTVGLSFAREAGPQPAPPAAVVLAEVTVPLPAWRRNDGARALAAAEVVVAQRERELEASTLRAELAAAAAEMDAAAARVQLHDDATLPSLESSLALLERAFELGEVDAVQVSRLRDRLLAAAEDRVDARAAYYGARARLESLAGVVLDEHIQVTP